MSLPKQADTVVIGAGIVGCAAAAALAARGESVLLIEKEVGPAREGSGRAQGSLRVQGRHAAEFPLAQEALELWKEAADDGDFEFVQGGNLYLQTTPDERVVLERLVREARAAGLGDVELLDPEQTREIIPAATGPFLGAMWSPIDAQAQPDAATQYFADRALRLGADLRYGVKALRLRQLRGGISGVVTSDGFISTERVVVAGGVWSSHLTRTAGVKVPLMPVIMSELETTALPPVFTQTIRAFGFGARQRPNGKVVVSAGLNARVGHGISLADLRDLRYWLPRAVSFRKALKLRLDASSVLQQIRARSTHDPRLIPDMSPEPRVDVSLVDASLERMQRLIPALQGARVGRYWAGLVDMTPDGLPVIDGHTGIEGLTVITGLAGHGLHLGPVLGEIAADLVIDGETSRPISTFTYDRFRTGRVESPEMMI